MTIILKYFLFIKNCVSFESNQLSSYRYHKRE